MAKEALFQATVTEMNGQVFPHGAASAGRALLLSTVRVDRFKENADNYTVFLYTERRSRRKSAIRYVTQITSLAFEALVREAANEDPIEVWVSHEWYHGRWVELASEYSLKFPIKDLIVAWDRDTESAYLHLEDAHFEKRKYIVSHTISEIDQTASISLSLSAS